MDKPFLCILLFSGLGSCVEWQEALNVHSYFSFRSGTLLKFKVTPGSAKVTWNFRASRVQDYCDNQLVDVYLHYGSLPVINPRNESFPDNFYLGRTSGQYLQLTSDNSSVPVTLSWPTPGSWYAVAFRPEIDNRIQQKGLRAECYYKLSTVLVVEENSDVEHIAMDSDLSRMIPAGSFFRFYIGGRVLQYTLVISQCNSSDCGLNITLYNSDLTENSTVCDSPPCVYTVTSPWLESWHYVYMAAIDGPVQVVFNVSVIECEGENSLNNSNLSDCVFLPELDRYRSRSRDFLGDFTYILNDTKSSDIPISVTYNKTTVIPFQLADMIDTGGSLKWTLSIATKELSETEHIRIIGQIQYGKLSDINKDISEAYNMSSLSANQIQVNSSFTDTSRDIVVPYPEAGRWAVSLTVQCYSVDNSSQRWTVTECLNTSYPVTMRVTTDRCVDNACSGHGECREYITGPSLIVYSTCNCVAGWRGYACSDGSEAFSYGLQVEDLLLLTLSNLFFIPAILLALRRKYYTEAIVFTYNMFFSAMYHACDGDRILMYRYCMTDYKILSFCDFLSSVASLWFTLVAMARLQQPMTSALQVAALLILPIGVLKEHTSLWLIAVPLACGVVILAVAWSLKCRTRRRCYPSRKRYLLCLLPGVVIAVTGASVFAFAETIDNYRYVHSAWHMCLFLSVLFLLPSGRRKGIDMKHSASEDSIQDLILTDHVQNRVT